MPRRMNRSAKPITLSSIFRSPLGQTVDLIEGVTAPVDDVVEKMNTRLYRPIESLPVNALPAPCSRCRVD